MEPTNHHDDSHFRGHLNKHDLDSREEARRRAAEARSASRARHEGAYTSGYRSPTSHYTSRRKREQYSAREEFDRLDKEARAAAAARPHSRRDQYERDEMAFRDHDPHARARLKAPLYEHPAEEAELEERTGRARHDKYVDAINERPLSRQSRRNGSRGQGRPSRTGAARPSERFLPAERRRRDGGFSASRDQVNMSPLAHRRGAGQSGRSVPSFDPRLVLFAIAAIALIAVIVGIVSCASASVADAQTVSVTIDGVEQEIGGSQDVFALLASGVATTPGDFLAIDGSVLQQGGGYPATVEVDGVVQTDYAAKLQDGAQIALSRGGDITEGSRQEVRERAVAGEFRGNGPIHVASQEGRAGSERVSIGETSGIEVVEEVTDEGEPAIYDKLYVNTNGEKVIALTFDDGPLPAYTSQILDILKENDAKATFFTIGVNIEKEGGADMVKRAHDEGHQVCTHTYDHAAGSGQGVNLGYMTPEEQVSEVQRGQDAIRAVIGDAASDVFRSPGGNFSTDVWGNVRDLISAEIGWNVDTDDWKSSSSADVAASIMSAQPGDIVLMHDGGGDRGVTVEALRKAIPAMKEQGYHFVTIDELMEYQLESR